MSSVVSEHVLRMRRSGQTSDKPELYDCMSYERLKAEHDVQCINTEISAFDTNILDSYERVNITRWWLCIDVTENLYWNCSNIHDQYIYFYTNNLNSKIAKT